MTFPIVPLPFVFLIGCLAGGFALVSLLSIAVWAWPTLLRPRSEPGTNDSRTNDEGKVMRGKRTIRRWM